MGLVAAIFGLAILVMIHEAGHFFAARAVGMTPRKFYLGFGPPIVKKVRNGVEYGIGSIPLGGYVKIPGMNRPSPGDLAASLQPQTRERLRAELARLDVAIENGDDDAARAALAELRPGARKLTDVAGARVVARARRVLAPGDLAAPRCDRGRPGRQPRVRLCAVRRAVHRCLDARHERDRPRRLGHACCILGAAGRRSGAARCRFARDPEGDPGAHPRDRRSSVQAARPSRWKARDDRTGAGEAVAGRISDRDRDRVAHRAWGVGAGGRCRFRPADVVDHLPDRARPRSSGNRPRHEPGVELGRDSPRLRAGVAPGPSRFPVRARARQPRARPAQPASRPAVGRRAYRHGARGEGARAHVCSGGLHALQRDRPLSVRCA